MSNKNRDTTVERIPPMIIKPRTMPLFLRKLKSLERRLAADHPALPDVQQDIAKWTAGYKGEKAVDYPLGFFSETDFHIFHDLRLKHHSHYFQLDTLLLSPASALVLEIKNISGTLLFDSEFHQLIRSDGEKEEAFPDPISQVQRHQHQLTAWLRHTCSVNIPVESLVVSGNSRSVLKSTGPRTDTHQDVIPLPRLFPTIEKWQKQYTSRKLSSDQLATVSNQLLQSHCERIDDVLQRYHIKQTDLVTGTFCPECSAVPMRRIYGRWLCPRCGSVSHHAHHPALDDYSLLISPSITNRQARQFLHIFSQDAAKRLLKSLNGEYSGKNKDRRYLIPVSPIK
ncbi:nuclease-related domain-containing protein [Salibacterium sp. K-3]